MSAADDQAATTLVLDVLSDRAIGEINFRIGDISVSPSMYAKVSLAITRKEITVIVAPSLLAPNVAGMYLSVWTQSQDTELYDVLILKSPNLGKTVNEKFQAALVIVHECTHAGFDLLKVPKMKHVEHEVGAYVAQSMFAFAKMVSMGGHPDKVVRSTMKRIDGAAWDLALLANQSDAWTTVGYAISRIKAINNLYVAIMTHPEYKVTAKDIVDNDGVGRPWKLPSPTQ
jgi:hypothetical protein